MIGAASAHGATNLAEGPAGIIPFLPWKVPHPRRNHRRYHERIDNLTPADVYFRRGQTILLERERIKRKTIQNRRLLHHRQAVNINDDAPDFSLGLGRLLSQNL